MLSLYLGGANGFTKFASNATLLSTGISSQDVFASETRTQWSLLERIVDGDLRLHCCFAG